MENASPKISMVQVILMITICRLFTAYAYMPIFDTPPENQDVWLLIPISVIYTLFFSIPLLYLGNKFAGFSLLDYVELILGKVFGKVIYILYFLFFFTICFMQMAAIQDFIHTVILRRTPVYVILFFMAAVCIFLVIHGLETIARITQIFGIAILLSVVIFSLLAIGEMNFEAFLPILKESRLTDLNFGGMLEGAMFSDFIILYMLAPNLKQGTNLTKIISITVSAYLVIFLIMVVSVQATLGIYNAKHVSYAYYTYTQQIHISDLIQHIESLNVTSLFFAVFIKFSIYLYLASTSLTRVFNYKNSKLFLIPIPLIIVGVLSWTNVGKDSILDNIISIRIAPYIFIVFTFVLPLIILTVYLFRRKKITSKIK